MNVKNSNLRLHSAVPVSVHDSLLIDIHNAS